MNKIVNGVANDYEFNDIGYYQEINIPVRQFGKTYQVINMYEQKYKQLQSNWNSLREWLEILINSNLYSLSFKEPLRNVLDKMNKLERKDKE